VLAEGKRLALFHDGDGFHALDDACPHRGASLGEGLLAAGTVICPWHSWTFDVRTGENPRAPEISVRRYAARVVGDMVEVEIPEGE
jgi:nitrite reductase/ring-hydroxylating ferredoxin subunit